jgi:hypothetical protein
VNVGFWTLNGAGMGWGFVKNITIMASIASAKPDKHNAYLVFLAGFASQ